MLLSFEVKRKRRQIIFEMFQNIGKMSLIVKEPYDLCLIYHVSGSPSSSLGSNSFTPLSPFSNTATSNPTTVATSSTDPWGYPSSYELSPHLNLLNNTSYQSSSTYCNSGNSVYNNNYSTMLGKLVITDRARTMDLRCQGGGGGGL